jgi:hypothetical protein
MKLGVTVVARHFQGMQEDFFALVVVGSIEAGYAKREICIGQRRVYGNRLQQVLPGLLIILFLVQGVSDPVVRNKVFGVEGQYDPVLIDLFREVLRVAVQAGEMVMNVNFIDEF